MKHTFWAIVRVIINPTTEHTTMVTTLRVNYGDFVHRGGDAPS